LTVREVPFPCGYAPRAIHLANDRRSLFVGAKDGSIHGILDLSTKAFDKGRKAVQLCGRSRSGVRDLSEWQEGWLWVARRDGTSDLIDLESLRSYPLSPYLKKVGITDPVRTIGWVDAQRRFISFQNEGTWVLPHCSLKGDPRAAFERSLHGKIELKSRGLPLSQILFIVPLKGPDERRFVLGNRRGEIHVWDGNESGAVERVELWEKGDEPAFINHLAVLWTDRQREEQTQARGIFLATDRGVHLIWNDSHALRPIRLALSGLGAVCMAITYAELEPAGQCYVWAADSRGDSHLYWGELSEDLSQINFRASGISHAGNQSMLAVSWCRPEDRALMVGQARRNNQIVLTEYREVQQKDGSPDIDTARWLLSQGDKGAMRSFWQEQEDASKHSVGKWLPAAQLSELFEMLAEESRTLKPLLEFLGDPTAWVAWEILKEILSKDDAVTQAREAIELWTLSLLGIINRTGGDLKEPQREAAYLGIIRWLLDLRRRADEEALGERYSAEARKAVIQEVDVSIGIVRKWGLFGEANRLRENLILPISVLRGQGEPEQDLDRLTYEVLLFERGLDLRAENRQGNLPGRNAWDISGLPLGERNFFAVSWYWGGVELLELQPSSSQELELKIHQAIVAVNAESASALSFQMLTGEGVAARGAQGIRHSQFGHSRAVLLGQLAPRDAVVRPFLITAPTLPSGSLESLCLWELDLHADQIAAHSSKPCKLELPEKESVYSLLDLDGGAGIAGLRSHGGQASCLFFKVTEAGGSLGFKPYPRYTNPAKTEMKTEGLTQGLRNRVWSLASCKVTEAEEEDIAHRVVLGCENGEILLLTLRRQGEELKDEWELVARMSSPIKALACRRVPELGPLRLGALRIIAGGADGSIVAWQEIPRKRDGAGSDPEPSTQFASLWAFYENEEISGLHLVDIPETSDENGPKIPMVLAITRAEQCFLYDDRHAIADLPVGEHPARIPVPGSRYGHFQRSREEPPSAFASFLVRDLPPELDASTGRVAAVMTASKHGVVRLLSVHYPHFFWQRKEQFARVITQWLDTLNGRMHQLRLVHAVYRSAPNVELILVRWLLDPVLQKVIGKPPDMQPWMLPRNLRPVLKLSRALLAYDETEAYNNLVAALREAFRLDDLNLFQEICEVVLRSENFQLFTLADQPTEGRREQATETYLKILEAIEHSILQWQGGQDHQESLARITVAKNLVDGDTFLRVLEAASREVKDVQRGVKVSTPFLRVLTRRIRGARELIGKRDPQVSLEALRAANLSLQRLCKRLEQRRRQDPKAEAGWKDLLEPYFKELTAAAARVFRSPLELNDAMAQSFARTFALAVCACPSAAIRIASQMAEAQLITDPDSQDDLCRLVPRQFEILEQLGTPVPRHAQKLFRIASIPPEIDLLKIPRWVSFNPVGDDWLWEEKWEDLGGENQRDLRCLSLLYGLVGWFNELERMLSEGPEGLDAAWGTLEERLDLIADDEDIKKLYGHSAEFWLWAVREFVNRLLESQTPDPDTADSASSREALRKLVKRLASQGSNQQEIRPITVLYSHRIAEWAKDMTEELRRRHDQLRMFQPHYTIFQGLFERLRRTAGNFPKSAAVKMNLVQGVLGHHLLEDLDEHILELQEIAHVLDPPLVRRYRQRIRDEESGTPTAHSFAMYLMDRSERAQSLPKNLRTLFALLDHAPQNDPPTFEELLELFRKRNPQSRNIALGDLQMTKLKAWGEFLSLKLILEELDNNDRKHTADGQSRIEVKGSLKSGARPALAFNSFFNLSREEADEFDRIDRSDGLPPRYNLARLWTLKENGLQGPIEPRLDRKIPSSGMGLYMANFTAATIGWELTVENVGRDGLRGQCAFHLIRQPGAETLWGGGR
jgi:hypothetical protein